MKNYISKTLLFVPCLFALSLSSEAQVKSNGVISNTIATESAFLDASSFPNTSLQNGKGLLFPRTDLTTFTFKTPTTNALKFPTAYDGMVVYNTATGNTASGVVAAITPGFYYFSNPGATTVTTTGRWQRVSSGSALLSGTGVPVGTLGSNGDFYIDTTTNTIYGPNVGGVWPAGTSLVGATGATGPSGAASEPWFNQATGTGATANTQNIYQLGNVGIGTTAPNAPLTVIKNGLLQTNPILYLESGSRFISTVPNLGNGAYNPISVAGDSGIIFSNDNDGITSTSGFVIAPYGNNSGLKVMENGNVGIGVAAPAAKLAVAGGIVVDNGSTNNGTLAVGSSLLFGGSTSGEAIASKRTATGNSAGLDFYSNFINRLAITNSGNVGIGIVAPTAKLDVRGIIHTSGTLELGINGSGNRNSFIDFHSQDGVDYSSRIIRNPGAGGVFDIVNNGTNGGPIHLFNDSGDVYLNTAGNVGIGTTAPSHRLDVNGRARIQNLPSAGAISDDVVTTEADGTLRRQSSSVIANKNTLVSEFNVGDIGSTSGAIPANFGTLTLTNKYGSTGVSDLEIFLPSGWIGNTNYVVHVTLYSNDGGADPKILTPHVFAKSNNSFFVHLQESVNLSQNLIVMITVSKL